ncbi:hypothetical protein GMYAFLOJ_CDS0087 [Microbacterium phage phiMiGM15]
MGVTLSVAGRDDQRLLASEAPAADAPERPSRPRALMASSAARRYWRTSAMRG